MKKILLFLYLLVGSLCLHAQLTLEDCIKQAEKNFPLVRQQALITRTEAFRLNNLAREYLPQISLTARATHQSDVTKIEAHLPKQLSDEVWEAVGLPPTVLPPQLQGLSLNMADFDIEPLSKNQYKLELGLTQKLWDGGATVARKRIIRAEAKTEQAKLEADIYALRERVCDLYFGILLSDEQERQNVLLTNQLQQTQKKVETSLQNGVASPADLSSVKLELLNASQQREQIVALRKSYVRMLSVMMGTQLAEDVSLQRPVVKTVADDTNHRPELKWMEALDEQLGLQEKALRVRHLPVVGLFLNTGYGRPGLNFLENKARPYYVAGVALQWNLSSLYTGENDRRLLQLKRKEIDNQREMFLFDSDIRTAGLRARITTLQRLIATDDERVELCRQIRVAEEAKADNGVSTTTDVLRELTKENMARRTKAVHEIEHLKEMYKLKIMLNQ